MSKDFKGLLGPAFETHTKDTLWTYIKSMINNTVSKNETCVEGIHISFGSRTTVVIKRNPKTVTSVELASLAKQFGKPESDLMSLFWKRKVTILDSNGAPIEGPKKERMRGKRSSKKEGNALDNANGDQGKLI